MKVCNPDTDEPLANIWDVNHWIALRRQKRFAEDGFYIPLVVFPLFLILYTRTQCVSVGKEVKIERVPLIKWL